MAARVGACLLLARKKSLTEVQLEDCAAVEEAVATAEWVQQAACHTAKRLAAPWVRSNWQDQVRASAPVEANFPEEIRFKKAPVKKKILKGKRATAK